MDNPFSDALANLNEDFGALKERAGVKLGNLVDDTRTQFNLLPPVRNYTDAQIYDPRTLPPQLQGTKKPRVQGGEYIGGANPWDWNGPTVNAYRADPTGRFGGTNGLETQPTQLRMGPLYALARDMAATKQYGTPQISLQDLAALALKEGREDFGANNYDHNNKEIQAYVDRLVRDGVSWENAGILAAMREKQAVAARLKIPFARAWNGTGTNQFGQTGADYARDYEAYRKAATARENAELLSALRRGYEDGKKYPAAPRKPEGKAAGGVVIDHGNPAKRERLI